MLRARLCVALRCFLARAPVLMTRLSRSSRFSTLPCEYGGCQPMPLRLLRQSSQLALCTRSFASVAELAHQVLSMPALSPTMNQGNVTNWKKKEGDEVAVGDVLCEIETDKATLDFESLEEGFLAKILVPAGSKNVQVGKPIAILVEWAEDIAKLAGSNLTGESHKVTPEKAEILSKSQESSVLHLAHTRIGPSVRRLLAESGLDISSFTGTGPGGIVTKGDILAALTSCTRSEKATNMGKTEKSNRNAAVPSSPALQKSIPSGTLLSFSELVYEDMPTSHIRKVIAKRLSESKNGIPHIYLSTDALLDETLIFRKELKEKHGVNVSVNDFVIRAVAFALKAVPGANGYWDEKAGDIVLSTSVDISIAVATDKGLMTPILHNADQKSLSTISSEVKVLIEKARQGRLAPHEFQGGSFSISNLGMFDVDRFCAIINPPQACILAIGRGKQAVIWEEDMNGQGRPRCATKIALTLSADHRVFNGDLGGQFLDTLSRIFSNPKSILL